MSALDPADARRLKGILSRLASDHDGEILAAAAAATRILDKAGLRFADLAPTPRQAVMPVCAAPVRPRAELLRPHQRRAMAMLMASVPWNAWERGFIEDMRVRCSDLTDGQQVKFDQLCAKSSAWHARQEQMS